MIGSGPPPATAADFHRDGCADLAIGVEWEAVDSDARAGAVNVLYGTAGGISADGSQIRTQDDLFTGDGSEPYEFFGQVLAAGDFDDDNYVDLAVGIPQEDIGLIADTGAVQILYGSADGIAVTGNQFWHQDIYGSRVWPSRMTTSALPWRPSP